MLKVKISVTLIDQGFPENIKFGVKNDLESITINAMNNSCSEEFESAKYIDIRHRQIFESECVKFKVLVLSSYQESTTTKQPPTYGLLSDEPTGYGQGNEQRPLNGPPSDEPTGYGQGNEQRPLNGPPSDEPTGYGQGNEQRPLNGPPSDEPTGYGQGNEQRPLNGPGYQNKAAIKQQWNQSSNVRPKMSRIDVPPNNPPLDVPNEMRTHNISMMISKYGKNHLLQNNIFRKRCITKLSDCYITKNSFKF